MLNHFIWKIFEFTGYRAWISLFLMVIMGLTQGVGLIMLIPFLQLTGLGNTESPGGVAEHISSAIKWLGLPLNLPAILLIYVGIVTAHAVIARYREVLNVRIVNEFIQTMRQKLYQTVSRAQWLCFQKSKTSDITHALTVDLQRVGFAVQLLFQLTGAIIIVGIHIAFAFVISIPVTLFALAISVGIFWLSKPFNQKAHHTGEDLRNSIGNMYSAISELLNGMKIAKTYNLGERYEENFRDITNGIAEKNLKFSKVNTATRMFYEIGAVATLALFFFVAVDLVHMKVSNLFIIVFLFARILPGFSMIQQYLQRILNALPSYDSVTLMGKKFDAAKESFSKDPKNRFRLNRGICFSNLWFRYDKTNQTWVLKNINLTIPAKTMTAIIGPSGAGKSTLAELIMGLISPDYGAIRIDEIPLSGEMLNSWRRSIGYVPQETFLFHDTIRANLLCALPNANDKDLWRVIRQAAAEEFISRCPNGLDTVVGDRGNWLSGGERQRIALARALLREPSLLLLDEPMSSLDPGNEKHIIDVLCKLRRKLTIVVIAHRHTTIQGADGIVALENGQVVDDARNSGINCVSNTDPREVMDQFYQKEDF